MNEISRYIFLKRLLRKWQTTLGDTFCGRRIYLLVNTSLVGSCDHTDALFAESHGGSFASSLQQVANLLCVQVNSASYPQRDGRRVIDLRQITSGDKVSTSSADNTITNYHAEICCVLIFKNVTATIFSIITR